MPSRSSSGDTHRREEHMSTRAHLVEPAGRTTASLTSPTSQRDVSFVRVGALRLRISRQGQGPPLLLLGGLGNSLGVWDNLVGELARPRHDRGRRPGYRVLLDSGPPALHGRVRRAVCQSGAISRAGPRCPCSAFRSVALSRSNSPTNRPGWSGDWCCAEPDPASAGSPGSAAALQELASPARYYSSAQSRRVTPLIYGGRFAREPESFSRELQQRLASPPSVYGYYCQLAALVGWSSLPWLGRIEAPTLVLAGDADPVYPIENATILGQGIPNARVEVLPGGGHLFVMDSAQRHRALGPGVHRR